MAILDGKQEQSRFVLPRFRAENNLAEILEIGGRLDQDDGMDSYTARRFSLHHKKLRDSSQRDQEEEDR